MRTTLLAALAVAGALSLGAGTASATTFCVFKQVADCPAGSSDEHGDNLNAALGHADEAADPDTVYIAPGTYEATEHGSTSFNGVQTHPVTVVGAGSDRVTLTTSYPTAPFVLRIIGPASRIELSGISIVQSTVA